LATFILYGVLPLIAFVVVDSYATTRWAVVAAIAFAVGDVIFSYVTLGAVDWSSVIALVLITGLGLLTLRMKSPLYVKLQPVAMSGIYALIVAYFQFFAGGVVTRYRPFLEKELPPPYNASLADPRAVAFMERAISGLILIFVLHGAWIAYAALKQSNVKWLFVRGLGFWVLLAGYFVVFTVVMIATGAGQPPA
jgi:intracellular septation protein